MASNFENRDSRYVYNDDCLSPVHGQSDTRLYVSSIIHTTRPRPPHHPLAAKLKVNNEMKTSGPRREGLANLLPLSSKQLDTAKHTLSFYRLSICECR